MAPASEVRVEGSGAFANRRIKKRNDRGAKSKVVACRPPRSFGLKAVTPAMWRRVPLKDQCVDPWRSARRKPDVFEPTRGSSIQCSQHAVGAGKYRQDNREVRRAAGLSQIYACDVVARHQTGLRQRLPRVNAERTTPSDSGNAGVVASPPPPERNSMFSWAL